MTTSHTTARRSRSHPRNLHARRLASLLAVAVALVSAPPIGADESREPQNVYAATVGPGLSPTVADMPVRVYVPNSRSDTVDVIDPATYEVVDRFPVGHEPHHVTPSWDLSTLYVLDTQSDSLTTIDPRTGKVTGTVSVADPYNLYFTPDGRSAVVVAERHHRLDFRDPKTWELQGSVAIPHSGADHLDSSADGSYLLVSCEYSGWVVKVDVGALRVTGELEVGGYPVDVKLSPDGTVFYVANQKRDGVSIVDPLAMREIAFLRTGRGAHGLYVSRDTRSLYVTNRLGGTISVIDFITRRIRTTWRIGGSPDMGSVTADGREFWVSGRMNRVVYVVDTETGGLRRTIRVGDQPHGLALFPQPGRFSLGHTGVFR